tara:strand:+ start:475 stop:654 length:180 start_codon:yes stop_codon:yes gene_type:complete
MNDKIIAEKRLEWAQLLQAEIRELQAQLDESNWHLQLMCDKFGIENLVEMVCALNGGEE